MHGFRYRRNISIRPCPVSSIFYSTIFLHSSLSGLCDTLQVLSLLRQTRKADILKPDRAYARARGSDRMSSFGDIIALSDEVDV